jgi:putative transposase
VPKVRGPNKKRRRLGAVRERLVDEAIQTHYLIRPKPPMEEAYRQIVHQCQQLALPASARNSVLKRIRDLDARLAARKRLGAKAAQAIAQSTPGVLEASEALELIQIDHTLATHCMHQSLNPLSRALAQSLRTTIYGSLAFGALARPLHSFR